MDLRLAICVAVMLSVPATAAATGARLDSMLVVPLGDDAMPSGELERLLEEWDGDVADLAAAEDLALDPVQVGTDDVERLRALPWIDAASLAALRAARDAASIADVSRLPGWSRDTARRVAPFVAFAPRRAPAGALHVQRSRGAWRARATAGAVAAAFRVADRASLSSLTAGGTASTDISGWGRIAHGAAQLWGGDLRLGCAQGIGLATAARAAVLPIARGAGLTGGATSSRTRVVRGAGAVLDARALHGTAIHGRLRDGTACTALATTVALDGAWQLHASAVHAGAARAASAGFTRARGPVALAAEVTSAPAAVAAAGAWRSATSQLALRALVSPGNLASPLTAAPQAAARDAAMAWTYNATALDFIFEAAHTLRRAATETARSTLSVRTTHHRMHSRVATFFAVQRSQRTGIDLEAPFADDARTTLTGSIAVERRLDPTWWGGVEVGAGARHADSLATAHTWQAWIERRRGAWRPFAAIASHTGASPGLGAPRTSALAVPALQGDRVRATLQVRGRTGPFEWRGGMRTEWAGNQPTRTVVDAALALDLRRARRTHDRR